MDRLTLLKQFVEDEPDDPFNLYALALEYRKTNPDESGRLFEKLITEHPAYLPTYYPYGEFLAGINDLANAERIYLSGIERAKAAGETKTLQELRAAYDLL